MWEVSGNSLDGACFKLDKQTWQQKSNGTQKTISQNLLIYRILNNENIKTEVEQTNFVTHSLYYCLCKNPSLKIWSNKFQMVIIVSCVQVYR